MLKFFKSKKGFTLVEMLVSVAIFSLIMTSASALFVTGLKSQRRSLSYQQLADQVSFAAEYISRSSRMAKKELFDHTYSCLTASGSNFENPGGDTSRLRFIKFDNDVMEDVCHEFYLDSGELKEFRKNLETGVEITQSLTSANLQVNSLTFQLNGETQNDDIQPLFTVFMDVQNAGGMPEEEVFLKLQTSVSQRNLDIRK